MYIAIVSLLSVLVVLPLFSDTGIRNLIPLVLILVAIESVYAVFSAVVCRTVFRKDRLLKTRRTVFVFLFDYFVFFMLIILSTSLGESLPLVGGAVFAFSIVSFLLRNVGQVSIGAVAFRIRRRMRRASGAILLFIENLISLAPILLPMYVARFGGEASDPRWITYISAFFALVTLLVYAAVFVSNERLTFFEEKSTAYWVAPSSRAAPPTSNPRA